MSNLKNLTPNSRWRGKTIVFCLPGNNYSGDFLVNFTHLMMWCYNNGIQPYLSQDYSSMVNYARCRVLGANVFKGKNQKPFGGNINYDYMMWIDSDIFFNVQNFVDLLEMDVDVASGWYAQPNGKVPVIRKSRDEDFLINGSYEYIPMQEIMALEDPFEVDVIGFGWVLIKHGVFEKIQYPWFAPKFFELDGGIADVHSEDSSCCLDIQNAGFKIIVNPKIRVGHEKRITI